MSLVRAPSREESLNQVSDERRHGRTFTRTTWYLLSTRMYCTQTPNYILLRRTKLFVICDSDGIFGFSASIVDLNNPFTIMLKLNGGQRVSYRQTLFRTTLSNLRPELSVKHGIRQSYKLFEHHFLQWPNSNVCVADSHPRKRH